METKPTDKWRDALSRFYSECQPQITKFEETFLRIQNQQTTLKTELAQIRKDSPGVNQILQTCKDMLTNIEIMVKSCKDIGTDITFRRGDPDTIKTRMDNVPNQLKQNSDLLARIDTEQRSLLTQYQAYQAHQQQQYQQEHSLERGTVEERGSKRNRRDGGSRSRRRRSIPKSSRKYKKSKRVFRKKSRSTRRR